MPRRGRGKPARLANLPHGRRVAVLVDVVDEEVPDLLLPSGEHLASRVGWSGEHVFAIKVETPPDDVNPGCARPTRSSMGWRENKGSGSSAVKQRAGVGSHARWVGS